MTRSLCLWISAVATSSYGFSPQAFADTGIRVSADLRAGGSDGWNVDIPGWLTERRIIGENNLEPIIASQETESLNPARAVARVETRDGRGFCTGSRVGRDLFLTNFHCFDFVGCDHLQFHLGYEKNLPASQQKIFHCKEVLATNEHFDYALYRVDLTPFEPVDDQSEPERLASSSGEAEALLTEYPIATLWVGDLSENQPVFIASHPRARLKEIDRSAECKLRSIVPEEFLGRETITHTCDTEGGSSGSPVFDRKSGRIVGLHWGGTGEYNMAIPMALIVQDWQSILSQEVLGELHIEK